MIDSIAFVGLFLSLSMGLLLFPKKNSPMNAVRMLPVIIIGIICVQAFGIYILQLFHMPVNIGTSCLVLLLANAGVWGITARKRKLQKLVWSKRDALLMGIPLFLVLVEAYHMFSWPLNLSYLNDDARVFFNKGMDIVRKESVSGTFFNYYISALFIEVAAPWLEQVEYYKAFIIGDIAMHLLEAGMFYTMAVSVCRQKRAKYFSVGICILYFLGYPTFSFMKGNFVYWSTGGLLFLFLLYALIGLERQWKYRKYYFSMLGLGIFGSIVCNRLYAIINPVIILFLLFLLFVSKKKIRISGKLTAGLLVMGAGGVLACIFLWEKLRTILEVVLEPLQLYGETYTVLYQDFLYFIPVFLLLFVLVYIKKRRNPLVMNMMLAVLACTGGMYVLYMNKLLSSYYYYKIYYVLWIACWVMVLQLMDILWEEKRILPLGLYSLLLAVFVLLQCSGAEERRQEVPYSERDEINYFSIYDYNFQNFKLDYTSTELADEGRYISPGVLEAYCYILDNYAEKKVCFLTDQGNYMQGRWFSAIVGKDTVMLVENYKEDVSWWLGGYDRYVVFGKQSEIYEETNDLFADYDIVYENDEIVMVKAAFCQ